jgi:uncharacterized protein (TIGR02246 family)
MPPLRRALLLSLVLLGCPAGEAALDAPQPREEFDEGARMAIEELLETQRQAWNRGDLDGFLAAYEASDALLFTSGAKIRRGYDETRSKYRERYGSASDTMGQLAFELLDVRGLGPDAAIVLGRYRLTDTPEASEGVFTIVLERQDGTWRIVHDHTSAAREPSVAAPASAPATTPESAPESAPTSPP